jgi:hypothetical protein
MISPLTDDDWQLILPFLQENQRLFGISIDDHLLTVDGGRMKPSDVYRTISAVKLSVLASSSLEMNKEWEAED